MLIHQLVCIFILFHAATSLFPDQLLKSKSKFCCQPLPSFKSCEDIKNFSPDSPSGYYQITSSRGYSRSTYCHMGELCGTEGGWTRVAYLDMSDTWFTCPRNFRQYQSGEVRACGRQSASSSSCQSVKFSSKGIIYSQVCGRVVGYQYGSPDAVSNYLWSTHGPDPNHDSIDSYYVDGVSLTHGYPRKHVWTFIAAGAGPDSNSNLQVQSFIGKDYFYESGNPSSDNSWDLKLYTQDPLWNGNGCVTTSCSNSAGPPWFNKTLNTSTTDYLELRVCGDQATNDEDVPVSFYEIYIK